MGPRLEEKKGIQILTQLDEMCKRRSYSGLESSICRHNQKCLISTLTMPFARCVAHSTPGVQPEKLCGAPGS